MYYTLTIKDRDYKLKLTTEAICQVEDKLGGSLLLIFGMNGDKLPTTREMITIFTYALQAYIPAMKSKEAAKLFDDWIEDGHTYTDFIPIIFEIFKVSGIIKNGNKEKNV